MATTDQTQRVRSRSRDWIEIDTELTDGFITGPLQLEKGPDTDEAVIRFGAEDMGRVFRISDLEDGLERLKAA